MEMPMPQMPTLTFENGDTLPQLGLGTWKSEPGEVGAAVLQALQLGYRHLDGAFIYGNEKEIGEALQKAFADGIVQREELWITSKLWNDAHAPDDVKPAVQKTLADLQLEQLDLYLMHWPVAHRPGVMLPKAASDMVPLDELPLATTWAAMEQLVQEGLVKHIGVSNFSVPKLRALVDGAAHKPEMNQVEMHPYLQQPELVAYCQEAGVHLTAYSPLGSPGTRPGDTLVLLQDEVVGTIADAKGCSAAQVLLAWALARGTAVIPKSVNPERLAQNLAATDVALTDDEMAQLAALDRHRRYIDGSFWAVEGSSYTVSNLWDE